MAFRGTFVSELRRRKVFRAAAIYIFGAWVAIQVAGEALPALNIPNVAIRYVWLAAIIGFPVALIFSWRYDFVDGGLVRTQTATAGDDIDLSLQRFDYLILIVLLLVSGITIWQAVQGISETQPEMANYDIELDAPPNSIVVLPLRTLGQRAATDYFSEGLTEELSYSLTRLPQLRVTATRSADTITKLGLDVREIGRRLGVRYILDGSVRRDDERIAVNLELVEADSASRIWQADFNGDANNLLALQTNIASSVIAALNSPLDVLDVSTAPGTSTDSAIAQDYYWLGMSEIREMDSKWRFGDWVDRAIDHFEKAIEADPDYAEAHARLARTHLYFLWSVRGDKFAPSTATAERHIERALAVNPELTTAHLAASRVLFNAYDIDGYVASLEHILVTEPSNIQALSALGEQYWRRGRIEEAAQLLRSAYLRDPLNPSAILSKASIDASLGDFDGAARLLTRLMQDHPTEALGSLIVLEAGRGRLDEVARWASLTEQQGSDALSKSSMTLAATVLGAFDIAEQWSNTIDASATSLTLSAKMLFLVGSGRADRAAEIAATIVAESIPETPDRLDLQQAQMLTRLSAIFAFAGDYERAMHEWNRIEPGFIKTHSVHEQLNFRTIMAFAAKKTSNDDQASALLNSLDEILSAMESATTQSPNPGYTFARAEWNALNGDFDAALEKLNQAYEQGFRDVIRLRSGPAWSDIETDPSFLDVVQRMESDVATMRQRALDEGWLRAPE